MIATVDTQQDALERQVLVFSGLSGLAATVSGQAQELGQHQEPILESLRGIRLGLALGLSYSFSLLLLILVGQLLLGLSLDGRDRSTPLVIDLLDLSQLLLVPGELGLKGRLVVDLSLLVGVDDLSGNELIGGLALVLVDQGLGLGGVGLDKENS